LSIAKVLPFLTVVLPLPASFPMIVIEKENSRIVAEMDEKVQQAEKAKTALDQWKQKYNMQTLRSAKGVSEILEELSDLGKILGQDIGHDSNLIEEDFTKVEEQFTLARVYANKTKTVVESLKSEHTRTSNLHIEATTKINELEAKIADSKDVISEKESALAKLEIDVKDSGARKRKLEEEMRIADVDEGKREASDIKTALEEQIENTRDSFQRQLSSLRDEIADRENQLVRAEEKYQSEAARQTKLKHELEEAVVSREVIDKKLKELQIQLDLKARARQETRGIEEITNKELNNIRSLRVAFVDDLQSRIKMTNSNTENDESASTIERQRIAFLENNLDQLTNVHKQLVRDNSELRCELPKMERRLMAKIERVKTLEVALRDSKERGVEERQRYQKEIEQIKSWSRLRKQPTQKTLGGSAHIAKPIRPGHRGQISSEASAVIRNTPEKLYNPPGIRRNV